MSFCIENINEISIDDGGVGGSCLVATSKPITIAVGATFNMIFDLKVTTTADDGTVSSVPADLSGYSIKAEVKKTSSSNSDLVFSSTQNRMISINETTARVSWTIPVKHTSRLPAGANYYCIKLIKSDGNTQKIIQGVATVSTTSDGSSNY